MEDSDPSPTVSEFAAEVLDAPEGERCERTFEDVTVAVPARFDGASPTADWRLDGGLAITVHREGG